MSFSGYSQGLVEELYAQYLENPKNVAPSWRTFFEQKSDNIVDGDAFGAFRHQNLAEFAFFDSFDFHCCLVSLDLGDHITRIYFLTLTDKPFRQFRDQ